MAATSAGHGAINCNKLASISLNTHLPSYGRGHVDRATRRTRCRDCCGRCGLVGGVVAAGLGVGLLALLVELLARWLARCDGRAGRRRRDRARSAGQPASSSARPNTAARAIRAAAWSARRASNLLAAPRQLRGARRRDVPDRDRDGRPAVHDAAADHLGRHSAIAYKRDFGLGGGPVDGLPRVIDLWWELGGAARHPVRARAVVGAGADRAPAGDRRRQPARRRPRRRRRRR